MKQTVSDIILALTKTIKALQLYGIDHPSFRNFYIKFYHKIADFLKKHNELTFQIERFTILHSNKVVYGEEEKDINIAFRLFRDGIRSIGFTEGLTSDELLRFLEIISQPLEEYDIALNLWESDFIYIHFYVVEEEDKDLAYKIPDMKVEHIDYDAVLNEMMNKEKIDIKTAMNPDLSFDELKTLKAEILNDAKASNLSLAITTFIHFLNIERSEEIIEGLIKLLEQSIENRDFYNARIIVHSLLKYPDISIIKKFENETTISGFRNLFNIPEDEIFNEFIAFIGFFSKKSIPHFLKIITSVKRGDRLEALRHRIAYIAQDDVSPIEEFLKSKDSMTLVNVIAILGIMKSKPSVSLIRPLMNHSDSKVRAEIVSTLGQVGEPIMVTKFIDDPDIEVRIKTLHVLTQMKYPGLYQKLLQRIKKRSFFDLEFTEQKEHFNCLITNGDVNLVKHLKNILFKWLLFGRKRYRIMRKLAATGLAQLHSEETMEILRQGAEKRNKDIKSACEIVLK